MIKVTVYNEYIHEVESEEVAAVYPKGIHGCIADFLGANEDITVKTVTLETVDEITDEVDYDSRAIYFKQAEYGMYARMALIMKMLENTEDYVPQRVFSNSDHKCKNPKCVTVAEQYLPTLVKEVNGKTVCEYCDKVID